MSTDLLETMRERARQTHPAGIDVEAAVRKGDRRRSGRVVGLSGLAAAAVVALGVTFLPSADSPTTEVAAVPTGPREVSWAAGSAIHDGDAVLDVSPWSVQAYVQTDDGFVFTDPEGGVHLATASGTEQIGGGVADGRYLRADDSGPGDSGHHVAWIDSSDATPALVVYDTQAREVLLKTTERFRPGMGTLRDDEPAFVYAVDGGYVYVRDAEGLSRVDVGDGSFEPLAKGVSGFDVADVNNGLIAHERPRPVDTYSDDGMPMTMLLGPDYSTEGTRIPAESRLLSPDASYVVTDYNDSEQIFEVATGKDVTPSLPGPFLAVSAWLDEETAAIITVDREGQVDMHSCNVVTGSCELEAASLGEPGALQLPIGEHLS
jgi:hypothetical protein